jgi:hypothetical protein
MQSIFMGTAWENLCHKRETMGYDSLSPDEKIWMNIGILIPRSRTVD